MSNTEQSMIALHSMIRTYPSLKVVCVDFCDTLSNTEQRKHFFDIPKDQPVDWEGFYAAAVNDSPNKKTIELVNALKKGGNYITVITSGRSDVVRADSESWLYLNGVNIDFMLFRHAKDFSSSDVIKRKWVEQIGIDNIAFALDDRDSDIKMYRELGILALQVADNGF
jgi:hypothetical protein